MSANETSAEKSFFANNPDLAMLGRDLWRKRRFVVVPTLLAAAAAIVFVNVATPVYRSQSRLLVESKESIFLRPDAEKNALVQRGEIDQEALASQVQILASPDLAHRVIAEIRLAELPEFDPLLRGASLPGTLLALLGLGRDTLRMSAEGRVLANFYDRLSVYPIEKSRVIEVNFRSSDPELAARAVNAVADGYLAIQRMAKQEQTRNAGQWLLAEIEKLRPLVTEAEIAVENFRAKSNLFVGSGNSNLSQQQLTELTTQLTAARASKAELDAKSQLIRNLLKSGRPVDSADIVNSDLFKRLIEQRVAMRAQLAEQSATLLERHPRILELRAQINALDRQIRDELARLVRSFETDASLAESRIEMLTASLDRLKNGVSALSGQDVELRALEREARTQRDLLESYLVKYREASARDSLEATPADARVISRAGISTIPVFPKKLPITLISTFAAAFVSAAFVVSASLLGESGLASIFLSDPAGRTIPTVESVADMLLAAGKSGTMVMAVPSDMRTASTAIGLARRLAARGASVVLVDLVFGASRFTAMASDPNAPGLAELMRNEAGFGAIVTRDKASRAHIVASGKLADGQDAVLSSPRLAMTLDALSRSYNHMVIDAGAMPDVKTITFRRLAPRVVLVAEHLSHPATQAASMRLIASGFKDVILLPASGLTQESAA